MSKSYRWMVDFDGVLANLQGAMAKACNEKFDTDYTAEEMDSWNWWFQQPKRFSDYVWRECYASLDWTLENVKPEEGAIEALCDLLTNVDDIAAEVRIVTARKATEVPIAAKWLMEYLPPDLKVVIAGTNGYRKAQYCSAYRLNVVVDDHAGNLRPMNAYEQRLYLVEKPYNAKELLAKVERVPSLKAAVANFSAYLDQRSEHMTP